MFSYLFVAFYASYIQVFTIKHEPGFAVLEF